MDSAEVIKKKLRKLKQKFPGMDREQVQRELFPHTGEEIEPVTVKKKKREEE